VRSKRVILIDGAGLHRARREREEDRESPLRERERERERESERTGSGARGWRASPGTRGRVALDGGTREGVVAGGS